MTNIQKLMPLLTDEEAENVLEAIIQKMIPEINPLDIRVAPITTIPPQKNFWRRNFGV